MPQIITKVKNDMRLQTVMFLDTLYLYLLYSRFLIFYLDLN